MKVLEMKRRGDGAADVLPRVWATDGNLALNDVQAEAAVAARVPAKVLRPEMAFYRTYTEAMLRRYAALSMESGRVPSLMGREMFRGKVTHYRVSGFDDVVIFVHDVEQCVRTLSAEQQRLILRAGVQEYALTEVAAMIGMSFRAVRRRYNEALDELTAVFLERKLLQRLVSDPCQEGGGSAKLVSRAPRASYCRE